MLHLLGPGPLPEDVGEPFVFFSADLPGPSAGLGTSSAVRVTSSAELSPEIAFGRSDDPFPAGTELEVSAAVVAVVEVSVEVAPLLEITEEEEEAEGASSRSAVDDDDAEGEEEPSLARASRILRLDCWKLYTGPSTLRVIYTGHIPSDGGTRGANRARAPGT